MREQILLGTWGIVMLMVVWQLYRWHLAPNHFDLRQYITSPTPTGVEKPDLSKLLLVVAMFASTYVLIKAPTDTTLGVYLGAWVLNRAVTTGGKVMTARIKSPAELRGNSESNHPY